MRLKGSKASGSIRLHWLLAFVLVVASMMTLQQPQTVHALGTAYYVDCSSGSNGSGTLGSPWNTLSSVNSRTFTAGDTILLKKGTVCSGSLTPGGSGSSGSPITIDAYGTGTAKPIISAGTNPNAIKLFNQSYWVIQNIETTGGQGRGIWISGDVNGTLNYFRLTNLTVHDVTGTATDKHHGLIIVGQCDSSCVNTHLNDVVIDHVTAYTTTEWAGIIVGNESYEATSKHVSNVTVQYSTVYDVYGDGIALFNVQNGLLQNNVTHDVGKIPTGAVGTPNGIWTWNCNTCTVQFNEAYATYSPGVDGGAFDIDYYNDNNIVQYNYGHDNQAYCVSVFGAEGYTTNNSIVRYNVCANNGRNSAAATQGDFFLSTWTGGTITNVSIYNNTSYWNPPSNIPAIHNNASIGSGTNVFKNNIIYSNASNFMDSNSGLSFNNNLYYSTSPSTPTWTLNGTTYYGFAAYKGTGQDASGIYADPLLNTPTYHSNGMPTSAFTLYSGSPALSAGALISSNGGRDFYNNAVSASSAPNIGAFNGAGSGTPPPSSIVLNAGFESGSLSPWAPWNSASLSSTNARTGTYAGKLSGSMTDLEQNVTLSPNTTYTLSGYAKTADGAVYIGVKNYGGTETNVGITSSAYTSSGDISFTTGASNTSATIYCFKATGTLDAYCDDFAVTPASGSGGPTTLFSDNFNDNSFGSAWSTFGGSWSESGSVLSQTSSATGDPKKAIVSGSGASFPASLTMTAKVKVNAWTDGDPARAGIGLFTGTGDGAGYNLVFHNDHSTVQFLDDGLLWGPSYSFAWTNGTWYWFKLKMEGGTLYGKVWQDGTSEPSTWPYSWARSGRTGYPALNGSSAGTTGSATVSFDDVTVSTN